MKIQCMLDKVNYKEKPKGMEIAKITKRLAVSKTEIEIEDLAKSLSTGCTFKASLMGGTKEADWIQSQLFSLDFDDGTTIKKELSKCREINILPVFMYTSFSHTSEHHKFRMVFCANEVINDYNIAKQLQLTLMSIFNNCDEKCKNLSRIFFGGKSLVYEGYENRINIKEILEKYPIEIDNNEILNKSKNNKIKKIAPNNYMNKVNITECDKYIKAIQNLDSEMLRKLIITRLYTQGVFSGLIDIDLNKSNSISPIFLQDISPIKNKTFNDIILVKNRAELYGVIDHINMFYILGLPDDIGETLFNCILPKHDDYEPSAHIIVVKDDIPVYKCFGCGFTGGLLKLIQHIAHCSVSKSINFIKDVFNIQLEYSDWQKEKLDMLEANKDYLLSGKMEYEYPKLFKRIKKKINRLIILIDFAEKNLYDETANDNDEAVFFISLTKLMQVFDIRSKDSVNNDITLFALLNLINKLSEENIPINLLNKAKHISAKNKFKKIANYYTIPSYDYDNLDISENNSKLLEENNFTMKGLSKEWILRTFGEITCNRIYPQYKFENSKGTSEKSNDRTFDIIKIIFQILESQNYVLEKDVTDILRKQYGKYVIEVQIKRSLQEILDGYGLKRLRCNKAIKDEFNVQSNGYPFIIIRDEDNDK